MTQAALSKFRDDMKPTELEDKVARLQKEVKVLRKALGKCGAAAYDDFTARPQRISMTRSATASATRSPTSRSSPRAMGLSAAPLPTYPLTRRPSSEVGGYPASVVGLLPSAAVSRFPESEAYNTVVPLPLAPRRCAFAAYAA